jgi:hypothetical protein
VAPMVWYVSQAKLFGANYGAMVVFPFANASLEAPAFQLSNAVDTSKHKVFAFGPDVTLPVASQSKFFALVNIRHLWETGARVKTEGQTLVVTATFPVPSVRLK